MRCKRLICLIGPPVLLLVAASAGGEVYSDDYGAYVRWQPHGAPPGLTANSILVDGGFAYVSEDMLRVYDLSDPDAPLLVGTLPGAESVMDKVGDILVCADNNTLNLVDVSDPASPVLRGSLEGFLAQVAADGGLAVATYRSGFDDYLKVIDISDPDAPALLAETFVTNEQSSAIEIAGDLAFIAYPYSDGFLQPVDLSDPTAPVLLAPYYNTAMDHHDLEMAPDRLYVIGQRLGEYSGRLQILDVSNPSSPAILGEAVTPYSEPALSVRDGRAYAVFAGANDFTVVDLSDEAMPRTVTTLDTRFGPRAVGAGADRAYVVGHYSGLDGGVQPSWLRIAAVTIPAAAPPIGELPLASRDDLTVVDLLAYVIGSGGLIVVDLADPAAPVALSTTDLGGSLRGIVVSGAIGYALVDVAYEDVHLRVLDLGDPSAPVSLCDFPLPGTYSRDLVLAGDRLCLALNEYDGYTYFGHLGVVNVSTPSAPVLESYVYLGSASQVIDIVAAGNQRVILGSDTWANQLKVFDISDPATPLLAESASVDGGYDVMALDGDLLVVGSATSLWGMGDGLISVLDAANPDQLATLSTLRLAAPAWDLAMGGGIPHGLCYAAGDDGGISLCSAVDPFAAAELITRNHSLWRLVDGGGFLVGLRRNFGLVTVPYHDGITAVDTPPPARPFLAAQPNPFNPATTLHFSLAADGPVRLVIVDPSGRRVRTLLAGDIAAGGHRVTWDGRDDGGRPQASGLFLARLETAAGSSAAKLLLLK